MTDFYLKENPGFWDFFIEGVKASAANLRRVLREEWIGAGRDAGIACHHQDIAWLHCRRAYCCMECDATILTKRELMMNRGKDLRRVIREKLEKSVLVKQGDGTFEEVELR
jgi:hypothetical protein